MTIFSRTWNAAYEQVPADTDQASEGALRIRHFKEDVSERGEVDHSWAGDASDGEHKKLTLAQQGSDPIAVASRSILYAKSEDSGNRTNLFMREPNGDIQELLPAGIMLPFGGSAIPKGWLACDGAAVSRTTYARLFATLSTTFGAGDGSTTFNVPDLRGRVPLGDGTGTLAEKVGSASVNTTNETWDVVSNNATWITGMKVQVSTDGGLPGGLSAATDYWIIRGSATTIKFATTLADAQNGTAINLTSQGSGTHTVTHTLTARARGEKLGEEAHAISSTELLSHTHTHSMGSALSGRTGSATGGNQTGGSDLKNNADAAHTHSLTINNTGGNAAMNNLPPGLGVKFIIKT